MSPFVPISLGIALDVVILSVGCAWLMRQTKRVAGTRSTEYRDHFTLSALPRPGDEVQILVEEDDGRTSEIEALHWPELGWIDAVTLLPVEDDVIGWRQQPVPARVREPAWVRQRRRH